jgi:putative two-component system response regulator
MTGFKNFAPKALLQAHILVVDDEPANVLLLRRVLNNAGYEQVQTLTDSREVASWSERGWPDIVLLDLMMPHLDGFGVLEQLKTGAFVDHYLPVLMLTADANVETQRRALAGGAKDFLTKPFDSIEVLLRVQNLLETRFLYRQLQEQNAQLETRVRQRTQQMEDAQVQVLERLAQAAEFRDDDTGEHTRRVGDLAAIVGEQLGLDSERLQLLRRAAPLHDVGKIGVPDSILLKPAKLTVEEFEVIKSHTLMGASLLKEGGWPLMQLAETIALTHHERFDGTGYPRGLRGDDIPLEGRIVAVVDVFDALTHERPYKRAWSFEEATREIESQSGRQFDPLVVEAFKNAVSSLASAV